MAVNTASSDWPTAALMSFPDAVIVTDVRGVIVMANAAAEALLDVAASSLVDRPVREVLSLRRGDGSARVQVPTARSFRKERDGHRMTRLRLGPAEGNDLTVDVLVSPIRGYRGTIEGCLYVVHDVSEELELERLAQDRQKLDAIGGMAGTLAQDFSTWLGVISSHALSISDNLIPKTRAHDASLRIVEAAKHASGLTRRLLNISRASSPDGGKNVAPVDLGKTLTYAVDLAQSTFAGGHISFRVGATDGMPYVMANGDQLLDCLLNLFRNSVDAMPDGGVLTVDMTERTESKKTFVVVRVRDNGAGMSRDVLDRVFEPFYTTKKGHSAVGLGLTVVKGSVEKWGGMVKVRSRAGTGTSFRLFIPKADVEVPRVPKRSETGEETILLVDDKDEVLRDAGDMLKKAGYKVLTARDGDGCIDLYTQHAKRIDLTIIDVVMPGSDGKTVLGKILEVDPSAPVIMTSGFSRDYVRGYLKQGAWLFVQKPLEREMLLESVRSALDQKKA